MLTAIKKKYIGSPGFYKRYILLAAPMIVQNAITNFVSFLDNIMVGQLGQEAISAVATVNQLIFVFYLAVFGAGSAAGIFGAQYFGKKDYKGHMYTFRFKLYILTVVVLLAVLLFLSRGESLILLFLTDDTGARERALSLGMKYLSIMLIGLFPFAINQAYASTIKETGQTVIPMVAGMIAVATNAVLDYLLIFGIGPFPEMGVSGAAIATVAARFIECFIVISWAHGHKMANRYLEGAFTGFEIPKEMLKKIFIKGTPLMLNEILWAAGMSTVTQCFSVRGMDVLTAISISNTVNNLFNIVFIQLGVCISIVVGQLLGAGELEEAKDANTKMIAFSVFCCIIMALIMFACGGLFPRLYNVDGEIRSMAAHFISVQALWMPFAAYTNCAYFTLRSGGKTVVTFLLDSVFIWVVMTPLAFVLAHFSGLSILWVYFFVQGTELLKVVVGYFMVKSDVWVVQMV